MTSTTMERIILLRYGEIALKGANRNFFESRLVKNIKEGLKGKGVFKVTREHGRIFVECMNDNFEEVLSVLSKTYGLVSYSPARVESLDMAAIEASIVDEMRVGIDLSHQGLKTFKVEIKRSNKSFPMTSPEMAKHLGGVLLDKFSNLKVDVHNPELLVVVEIRDKAYIFTRTYKGQGGMPYKTGGKAMLLLSGGIDSPVAGYLMSKRGVEIEAIHFHSYPFTSERAQEKVWDLARKLAHYTGRIRVHSVNLLEIQQAIAANCPSEEMTILSRRFMMAIATEVAKTRECGALVTGESLGQVASQTMEGIAVTTDATSLPVLRPLIAMDKVDIMAIAHSIDTFETSILPFEDCCTVFLPDKVVTRPSVEAIRTSEALLNKEALIANAIDGMEAQILRYQSEFIL